MVRWTPYLTNRSFTMRPLMLTLATPLLFACAAAQAGNLVDVQVLDRDGGGTLVQYPARGKQYVAGIPGHRYSVRLTNRTGARVMTVLSVDGVNAVSGETANPDQSGYVLEPYESTEIAGWRKDMSAIAAFEFTALTDSYAARTGRPDNVGVIGVAVFRERTPPPPTWREKAIAESRDAFGGHGRTDSAASPPPAPAENSAPAATGAAPGYADRRAAKSAPAGEPLGTGHGERESSYASYTKFERDSARPYEVLSVWYDSMTNLQARGVVPRPRPVPAEPQAFPAGFVADPPASR
jgi:hypothetical protein